MRRSEDRVVRLLSFPSLLSSSALESHGVPLCSHDRYWKNISADAKAFISALIRSDPAERPTAEQALKHKWIVEANEKDHAHDLGEGFRANWCVARLMPSRFSPAERKKRFMQ